MATGKGDTLIHSSSTHFSIANGAVLVAIITTIRYHRPAGQVGQSLQNTQLASLSSLLYVEMRYMQQTSTPDSSGMLRSKSRVIALEFGQEQSE